jgi:hypothetical protein
MISRLLRLGGLGRQLGELGADSFGHVTQGVVASAESLNTGRFEAVVSLSSASSLGGGITDPRRDKTASFQSVHRGIDRPCRDRSTCAAFDLLPYGNAVCSITQSHQGQKQKLLEFSQVRSHVYLSVIYITL